MEIRLATRPKKKKWFAIASRCAIALTLISAFALVGGRMLENAALFALSLIVLISLGCIQAAFSLLNAIKWIKTDEPNGLESVILSENMLLMGKREVPVSALKSLIIESDGYAGKWAGRNAKTGHGKLTFIQKADKCEESCLIIVGSLAELGKLRALSEIWKSRGVVALVMD